MCFRCTLSERTSPVAHRVRMFCSEEIVMSIQTSSKSDSRRNDYSNLKTNRVKQELTESRAKRDQSRGTVKISARVSPNTSQLMLEAERISGVTRSKLVRRAIKGYLRRDDLAPPGDAKTEVQGQTRSEEHTSEL